MKKKSGFKLYDDILKELNQIKKAFKSVEKIKAGKLKTRPVEQLLSEI